MYLAVYSFSVVALAKFRRLQIIVGEPLWLFCVINGA